MTHQTTPQRFDHHDLLLFVPHALQLKPETIYHIFSRFSDCQLRYYERQEKEYYVELRFDTIGATATCHFTPRRICHTIYIFFDDIHTIDTHIPYLHNHFPYDYSNKQWQLPHCHLQLHESPDDRFLVVF